MDNVQVQTKTAVKTDSAVREFDKVTLITLSVVAIGFGVFAFASIAGAVATGGLSSLFSGFAIAIGIV